VLVNIVNGANVGMVQRRSCARFTLEALDGLRIASGAFGQEFQGHVTAETRIFRAVHDSHPAATQFIENAIVRKRLTDHDPEASLRLRILGHGRQQVNDRRECDIRSSCALPAARRAETLYTSKLIETFLP
jgi:hypothetical protein